MKDTPVRKYTSSFREQQVNLTRECILEATKRVLAERGYGKTTMDAIAREAGISPQTIYLNFKNKQNIFAALIEKDVDREVQAFHDNPIVSDDIYTQIQMMVDLVTKIHLAEYSGSGILHSIGYLSPDLARIQKIYEERGQKLQREHTARLLQKATLKKGLTIEKAQDIFWGLTKSDLFMTFVQGCGWTIEEYKTWLFESLMALLSRDGVPFREERC